MSEFDPSSPESPSSTDELGDPETSPNLPATTLAAHAAPHLQDELDVRSLGRHTTREILRLSWPVMLAQGAVTFAGIIDRAMVGRLGDGAGGAATPLAAVGLASQFFFLVQSSLFAIGLACVALMARAIGARTPRQAQLAFSASIQVAVAFSLLLSVVIALISRAALELLGAEPPVVEAAIPYLNYVLASSVLLAVSLVIESALRANKDMRTPMWIAAIVMAAKLGLNWLLIFGNWGLPRLELVGAGLATALSQALALVLLVAAIVNQRRDSPLALTWRDITRINSRSVEVIRIAIPGIAERLVMNLAMISYIWVLSRHYGTIAVAAYTVGIPLLAFSWIPGTAYAQAAATMIGQCLGARDPDQATRIGWHSARLAIVTAIVLGLAFGYLRYPLARLLTNDADVIAALGPFMLVLALAQPLLQLQFALGGAHRGAGDTLSPLIAAMIGNWIFRLPLAFGLGVFLHADIIWIWCALIFDHLARSIYLTISFKRGKWKERLD